MTKVVEMGAHLGRLEQDFTGLRAWGSNIGLHQTQVLVSSRGKFGTECRSGLNTFRRRGWSPRLLALEL